VSLDVKLDGDRRYRLIRFVVCANVSHDCLSSLADYRKLLDSESHSAERRTIFRGMTNQHLVWQILR